MSTPRLLDYTHRGSGKFPSMHGLVTGPPHWARQQFLDVPLQTGVGRYNPDPTFIGPACWPDPNYRFLTHGKLFLALHRLRNRANGDRCRPGKTPSRRFLKTQRCFVKLKGGILDITRTSEE